MRDQDLGIEKSVRRKVWSEKWKIEEGERIMKQERRRMKKEWRERKRNEREKQKLEEQERKKIDALERKNLLLTWMESERKKEVAGGWQPYQLIRRNMPVSTSTVNSQETLDCTATHTLVFLFKVDVDLLSEMVLAILIGGAG